MRYLLLAVLTFAGCAPVNPITTFDENNQIAFSRYQAQPVKTAEVQNNFKQELKQNYHEAIGPSPSFDRFIEATSKRSMWKTLLEDETLLNWVLLTQVAKTPEQKKKVDEMDPKERALYANGLKGTGFPEAKKALVTLVRQLIEKLDAEIDELQKVIDQEMRLAELKYENKRLRQQRAALALSVMGQSLQNAGQAMQQSQALQNQQFYQLQMLNKQDEILRQLQMHNLR